MKNNDDILSTDTTKIKQLINRVKQGELDQGDALLIEKLLNFLLTIVSLLQRKHTSIRRVKGELSVLWHPFSYQGIESSRSCRRRSQRQAIGDGAACLPLPEMDR